MAKLVIELASGSSVERVFKKTNAEVKNFLIDYINGSGHDTPADQLTNAQLGTTFLDYIFSHMREVAMPVKRARLEATQQAALLVQQETNRLQIETELDI